MMRLIAFLKKMWGQKKEPPPSKPVESVVLKAEPRDLIVRDNQK